MIWVYGILTVLLVLTVIAGRKRYGSAAAGLNRKEHPLKILYPAALLILGRIGRPGKKNDRVSSLLKGICVKENVEKEKTLHYVRKVSLVLAVSGAAAITGFAACAAAGGIRYITQLKRLPYGQGTAEYKVNAEYRSSEEVLDISIDELRYSPSEILEKFENSKDEVNRIMLGENESPDAVTEPLNLITEYDGFSISWEIEDISALDYSGNINAQPEEGESLPVNLFAVFSLDSVSQIYSMPVNIVGKELSSRDKLLKNIKESIEAENDPYDMNVKLPDEIGGYRIRFRETQENTGGVFLLMGIIGAAVILIFYDRRLEEKMKKRREQLAADYPEIVSKLSLLYDAGLSIKGSFERIVQDRGADDSRFAYREIRLALEKIGSGVSEAEAYSEMGKRCGIYSYIRLGNILEHNLSKGTRGMKQLLAEEAASAFEERKRIARKKGEEASTKMLFPMMLELLVVIAIIAVPALISVNI
ncbi:MAG: hypothetical protein HUJ76_03355 [Parasporobacterium sp.]|nr:hypothetical protein [Parasporobacterium sp.]